MVWLECEADAYLFEGLICGFQLKEADLVADSEDPSFREVHLSGGLVFPGLAGDSAPGGPQRGHELELRRDRTTSL